jgi:HAD superfamily (subfamily IIIA) phosphatase, TIGR01668
MKLFRPTAHFKSVFQITPEILKKFGIKAVILDADNTIRNVAQHKAIDGIDIWLQSVKQSGIKVILLSNNFSSNVRPFAKSIELDHVAMALKPMPFGVLRVLKRLGSKRKETAMIGDQVFTDIVASKFAGVKSFLVDPLEPETHWFWVWRRSIERKVIKSKKDKR